MTVQASLKKIRTIWVERISREMAAGEGVRTGFAEQLERFYELLEQSVSTGDMAWLDPILYDWGRSPTETNLEQGDYYVSFVLNRMISLTIEIAREQLKPKEAIELLEAVIPLFTHSLGVVIRYEMETRVAHISKELGDVQEKLQILDQNKSKFISVAAHELKTPLTLIEGYTSMMADMVQDSEQVQMKNYLSGVNTGILRLRDIIDDMIDVSLIDNHLLTLNVQPMWTSHLLNLIRNEFKKPIAERRQNLNIDAQLGDGVRLSLITYLSSRHHSEAWVKGGYIQFDKLPFAPGLDDLMKNFTIRLGHMEINYGDAHFRRTDNGNALYNPFVGNLIMDAFNTEIGGEIYFQKNGAIAMVGVTGGEIKGNIKDAGDAKPNDDNANPAPTFLVKLGYDSDVSEDLRIRLTGSMYYTGSSASNSLYSGDRGGSRYYLVMENLAAAEGTNFRSGRWNPGFSDNVTAFMINPFVKFQGLELFGTYEMAKGRKSGEAEDRTATQIAVEAIYRIGEKENVFIGGRYNTVTSETAPGTEIQINRIAGSIGWFINPHILMKAEYVTQDYNDFPNTDILFEGNFSGLMLEAVVGF